MVALFENKAMCENVGNGQTHTHTHIHRDRFHFRTPKLESHSLLPRLVGFQEHNLWVCIEIETPKNLASTTHTHFRVRMYLARFASMLSTTCAYVVMWTRGISKFGSFGLPGIHGNNFQLRSPFKEENTRPVIESLQNQGKTKYNIISANGRFGAINGGFNIPDKATRF